MFTRLILGVLLTTAWGFTRHPASPPSPAPVASSHSIPGPLLGDRPALPEAPEPAWWLLAWGGKDPGSRPELAIDLSQTDPEAYAAWLGSLYPGRRVEARWATVTAYCPCSICCSTRTGVTSTGLSTDSHPYGVAADPGMLPPGSEVHVAGYKTASAPGSLRTVDDTGGTMRQAARRGVLHIDVRFVSHSTARRWGVQERWIYVVY